MGEQSLYAMSEAETLLATGPKKVRNWAMPLSGKYNYQDMATHVTTTVVY
jgi:hypothetical protein